MFTEITWATYLRVVAALMFIYYVLLIVKFYFPQISASLSSAGASLGAPPHHNEMTAHTNSATLQENEHLTSKGSFTAAESGNDYEIIEEIVERVKSVLQHAADTTMEPAEVTSSFRTILSDYPTLASSTFKPSINEFIANESEQHGYLTITQEAVEHLWPTK
jgi:hypothetical protein